MIIFYAVFTYIILFNSHNRLVLFSLYDEETGSDR